MAVTPKPKDKTLQSVSIPVWYDWQQDNRCSDQVVHNVSIPVWYDWQHVIPKITRICGMVSIPVWYDWQRGFHQSGGEVLVFQFQFGTIGRVTNPEVV